MKTLVAFDLVEHITASPQEVFDRLAALEHYDQWLTADEAEPSREIARVHSEPDPNEHC